MKYITGKELTQISSLIDTLNEILGSTDIHLTKAGVSDQNGDILGHISICDDGDYAFILSFEDE